MPMVGKKKFAYTKKGKKAAKMYAKKKKKKVKSKYQVQLTELAGRVGGKLTIGENMPFSKYSPKQKRLAKIAKPRDKITGADFAMLKKRKKRKKRK